MLCAVYAHGRKANVHSCLALQQNAMSQCIYGKYGILVDWPSVRLKPQAAGANCSGSINACQWLLSAWRRTLVCNPFAPPSFYLVLPERMQEMPTSCHLQRTIKCHEMAQRYTLIVSLERLPCLLPVLLLLKEHPIRPHSQQRQVPAAPGHVPHDSAEADLQQP